MITASKYPLICITGLLHAFRNKLHTKPIPTSTWLTSYKHKIYTTTLRSQYKPYITKAACIAPHPKKKEKNAALKSGNCQHGVLQAMATTILIMSPDDRLLYQSTSSRTYSLYQDGFCAAIARLIPTYRE